MDGKRQNDVTLLHLTESKILNAQCEAQITHCHNQNIQTGFIQNQSENEKTMSNVENLSF